MQMMCNVEWRRPIQPAGRIITYLLAEGVWPPQESLLTTDHVHQDEGHLQSGGHHSEGLQADGHQADVFGGNKALRAALPRGLRRDCADLPFWSSSSYDVLFCFPSSQVFWLEYRSSSSCVQLSTFIRQTFRNPITLFRAKQCEMVSWIAGLTPSNLTNL